MVAIENIEQFNPEFVKDEVFNKHKFTVEVQYRGVFLEGDDEQQIAYNYWAFKLYIDGELVAAGPFRHDVNDRELTRENVANNLLSFYGHGDVEKLRAQARLEKAEAEFPNVYDLVANCRAYAIKNFKEPHHKADDGYEVIKTEINGTGWEVILEMNFDPSKIFIFYRLDAKSRINVTVCIKAYKHSIPNF